MTALWQVLVPSLVALTALSFGVRFLAKYVGGAVR